MDFLECCLPTPDEECVNKLKAHYYQALFLLGDINQGSLNVLASIAAHYNVPVISEYKVIWECLNAMKQRADKHCYCSIHELHSKNGKWKDSFVKTNTLLETNEAII